MGQGWIIFGLSAYAKTEYDDVANPSICAIENANATAGTLTNIANCSNNWGVWFLGSRTQYNFTPAFYVGFDVTYSKLLTADQGTATYLQVSPIAKPTAKYSIQDQDNLAFRVRLHRDILPWCAFDGWPIQTSEGAGSNPPLFAFRHAAALLDRANILCLIPSPPTDIAALIRATIAPLRRGKHGPDGCRNGDGLRAGAEALAGLYSRVG
jgi:hypothetical protein